MLEQHGTLFCIHSDILFVPFASVWMKKGDGTARRVIALRSLARRLSKKINMTHCCPVCHDQAAQSVLTTDTALTMVKPELPKEGVCIFKKVTYPNEAKWYTSIMLLGEPTCGACMCKNGLPKCTWTECSRFKCSSLERNKDSCCYRCQRRINRSKKNRRKIL